MVSRLLDALKTTKVTGLKEKMSLLMNIWLTYRQMEESEAVYKVFKDFHFKESSVPCIFVQACPKDLRSKYLIRADDKPEFGSLPKVSVANREGEYIEKHDIIDKYVRRSIPQYSISKNKQLDKIFKKNV